MNKYAVTQVAKCLTNVYMDEDEHWDTLASFDDFDEAVAYIETIVAPPGTKLVPNNNNSILKTFYGENCLYEYCILIHEPVKKHIIYDRNRS